MSLSLFINQKRYLKEKIKSEIIGLQLYPKNSLEISTISSFLDTFEMRIYTLNIHFTDSAPDNEIKKLTESICRGNNEVN